MRAIALSVALLAGCAAIPLETVFVPMDPTGWVFASGSNRKGATIAEYVPVGQSIENWRQLLTIQLMFEGSRPNPAEVMRQLKARMEARCSRAEWATLEEEAQSILYEWKIDWCPGQDSQHEIARLLLGNDGLHRVALTTRDLPLSPEQRDKWITSLKKAYVEKSGQRVNIAP